MLLEDRAVLAHDLNPTSVRLDDRAKAQSRTRTGVIKPAMACDLEAEAGSVEDRRMDTVEDERTPYQRIKQELLCGTCRAAKFMFWDAGDLGDEPSGLTRDRESGLAFLVRCDYFRLTVQSPHALKKCEGHQRKGKAHS